MSVLILIALWQLTRNSIESFSPQFIIIVCISEKEERPVAMKEDSSKPINKYMRVKQRVYSMRCHLNK